MSRRDFTFSIKEEDVPRVIIASAKMAGWKEGDIETADEASLRYWITQIKKVVISQETQDEIDRINSEKNEAIESIVVNEPDVI